MHDMPRKLPLYVCRERDRHGVVRFYFRQGKGNRVALPAPNDSGFMAAYTKALNSTGDAAPVVRAKSGTLGWLVEQYRQSGKYLELSKSTRYQRDFIYRSLVAKSGHHQFASIKKTDILKAMEKRKDTPFYAANFLKALRSLFKWAVDWEFVESSPVDGVSVPKQETDGHVPWDVDDVVRYRNKWKIGTRERVWFEVLFRTGLRRGDACVVGKQHIKDGVIAIKTEKTGTVAYIVVDQEFENIIKAGPTGDMALIVGKNGEPLNKDTFGNYIRAACNAAGVKKSAHGIRKFAAAIDAENGMSEKELDAKYGWTDGKMASFYTKSADRKRLAINAAARIRNNSPLTKNPVALTSKKS